MDSTQKLVDGLGHNSHTESRESYYYFVYTHLGYPLNFIIAFHGHVKGVYLCLAEVKWVKTGVPGVIICEVCFEGK